MLFRRVCLIINVSTWLFLKNAKTHNMETWGSALLLEPGEGVKAETCMIMICWNYWYLDSWLLILNSILLGRMALSSSSLLWKLSMAWTYGIGCERWSMFWRSYQNKTLAALVVERTEGDPLRIATTCSSVSPITMIFVISTSHCSEPQFSSILNSQLLSDWKSRCISISFSWRCSILF